MPKFTAIKEFSYGGKLNKPGEEIDVSEKDVRILIAIGRIERSDKVDRSEKKVSSDTKKVSTKDTSSTYRRKDMRAEG